MIVGFCKPVSVTRKHNYVETSALCNSARCDRVLLQIDGLVQDCGNSSVLAIKLQSYTEPQKCPYHVLVRTNTIMQIDSMNPYHLFIVDLVQHWYAFYSCLYILVLYDMSYNPVTKTIYDAFQCAMTL